MARMSFSYPLFACLLLLPSLGLAADPDGDPAPVRWCGQSTKASEKVDLENPVADDTSGAGLRAFVDPVTGELVDEPPAGSVVAPAAPEQPQVVAPVEDLPVTVSADGTESVELGDRFMTELRTEVINGKLVTCHVPLGSSNPTDTDKKDPDGEQGDARDNGH